MSHTRFFIHNILTFLRLFSVIVEDLGQKDIFRTLGKNIILQRWTMMVDTLWSLRSFFFVFTILVYIFSQDVAYFHRVENITCAAPHNTIFTIFYLSAIIYQNLKPKKKNHTKKNKKSSLCISTALYLTYKWKIWALNINARI